MDKNNAFILHIRDSINLIEEYAFNITKETLTTDLKSQDAIVHQIQNIGEAVKRLSPDFIQNNPSLPWSEIAQMRDRIVHHYFDIDLNIVWSVIIYDIPELKEFILDYISKKNIS